MLRSFLIGLLAGSRALTPLATVSAAAARGALPGRGGGLAWLADPLVSTGLKFLAAAELGGDKLPSAPNRTGFAGLLARIVTGGLAGAALARRRQALAGAALGAAAALAGAYLSFGARRLAMRRFGQAATGVAEDALTLAASQWVVAGGSPGRPPTPCRGA